MLFYYIKRNPVTNAKKNVLYAHKIDVMDVNTKWFSINFPLVQGKVLTLAIEKVDVKKKSKEQTEAIISKLSTIVK